MQTPDFTRAQLVALVQAAIAVALAFGAHLNAAQQDKLLILAGAIAGLLVAADVAIRRGRQRHLPSSVDAAALEALRLHVVGLQAAVRELAAQPSRG